MDRAVSQDGNGVPDPSLDEREEPVDHDGVLEIGAGSPGIRVHFHLAEVTTPSQGDDAPDHVEVLGYLRLALGQGNFANRLLNSLGKPARLVLENGAAYPIVLSDSAPGEAPGYLCSFHIQTQRQSRAA